MGYSTSLEFVASLALCVITLCADSVILACVWKDLKIRSNLIKKLLFLIGIVDLFMSLSVIVRLLLRSTTNSFIACTFSLFTELFMILMHFGVAYLLALERVISLGAPFWYHRNCNRRILYLCVVFIIVICMPVSFSVTTLALNDIRENIGGTTACITMLLIPSPSMIKVTSVITSMGLLFLFLTLICNCVVLRLISIMNRTVFPTVAAGRKNQNMFVPAEFQMTRLCVVLCCSYCLLSVPFWIVFALYLFGVSITTTVLLKANYLLKLGFVVDPFIYLVFKKKYRQWVWGSYCKLKNRIVCHCEKNSSPVQAISYPVPERSYHLPEISAVSEISYPVSERSYPVSEI